MTVIPHSDYIAGFKNFYWAYLRSFAEWILLNVLLTTGGRVINFPWIQTSRDLSCSTTAWTNSRRSSRHLCASTQCPTLSTSSTRVWTASCRQGRPTASVTSWADPWLGWALQEPPPCCLDTPPWGGSAPLSPARPCTIIETTTPRWAASPSRAPTVPWRLAVWAAGQRAAVTGEEGGSSAPTVSLNAVAWAHQEMLPLSDARKPAENRQNHCSA